MSKSPTLCCPPPTLCCVPCHHLKIYFARYLARNRVAPYYGDEINGKLKCAENGTVSRVYKSNLPMKMDDSELEEQFKIVDTNKDGYIDEAELKVVMRNLGISHSDEEISQMIQHADVNGSGKIEQDDFIKVMSDYLDSEIEETFDVKHLFDFFDADKDGFITQEELQFAISEILQDTISDKEISGMMRLACKKVKKSKKAMISFHDFEDLLEEVGFTA